MEHVLKQDMLIQAVLHLHSSLTTRVSKLVSKFIMVLSFVYLVLNHSSAYTVVFPKSQKTSVSRGPPVFKTL